MKRRLQKMGVLSHPHRDESLQVAQMVAQSIRDKGLETWVRAGNTNSEVEDLIAESDIVVVIGGDGALLRAAHMGAPYQTPIFGLNMGYLGFLTEAKPAVWQGCLERLIEDNYWIEERLMIRGEVWRNDAILAQGDALNDIVIGRGAMAKTIHLNAYIDGAWITKYAADGLIIATATGSTAYALAAGGPIMPPELDNLLMVPVAPHFSMDRPVILSQGVTVKIVVASRTQADTIVTVDGRNIAALSAGDEVYVKASDKRGRFVRLQERNYFFRSLMGRMEPRISPIEPSNE